jgi:ATP-binding cassette, subfamily C, bacterial CydCD
VITGPSGSGKSTVLSALLRTLEPRSGGIAMDGVDTRRLTGDDVRHRIAWCRPAPHLFDSTLRENLRLARTDAMDEGMASALRRAGLRSWLRSLPDGLDTLIGALGGTVSGGERQRIGLARALLADRPVLLLDEPTAHLDEPTAHLDDATADAICADVLRPTAGRTAVITSHRPGAFPGVPQVRLTAPDPPAIPGQRRMPVAAWADEGGRTAP